MVTNADQAGSVGSWIFLCLLQLCDPKIKPFQLQEPINPPLRQSSSQVLLQRCLLTTQAFKISQISRQDLKRGVGAPLNSAP